MKKFFSLLIPSLILSLSLTAQISTDALLQDLHWRNIGPANQGGRIVDIEALDNDFTNGWITNGSGGVCIPIMRAIFGRPSLIATKRPPLEISRLTRLSFNLRYISLL